MEGLGYYQDIDPMAKCTPADQTLQANPNPKFPKFPNPNPTYRRLTLMRKTVTSLRPSGTGFKRHVALNLTL